MSFRINGSSCPIPTGQCREGPGGILHMQWVWITAGVPSTEGPKSHIKQIYLTCVPKDIIFIILDKKQICLLLHRYWMLYLPRLFPKKKKILVKTVQSKEASASAQKMYRNTKETWRTVSQLLHIYYGWMYLSLWLSIQVFL